MTEVHLTLACGRYDRTQAIFDGTLQPEGLRLNGLALTPPETFRRMMQHAEFEVAEMSLGYQMSLVSRGDFRFAAIPVFLSRAFRHSAIFVNTAAGIQSPADLRGKRVGTINFNVTAVVWVRGLLQHEYGVSSGEIRWYIGEQRRAGLKPLMGRVPAGLRAEPIPEERTLEDLLERGDLDAAIVPDLPQAFLAGSLQIQRLFPDFKAVEADYYRRTGVFPIMHCLVLRRDVYERYPWAARSLYKVFTQAKDEAARQMYDANALRYTLPWLVAEIEETRRLFGGDPWPYGLARNRATIETLKQYLAEQGLLDRDLPIEEIFVPNVRET